MAETCPDNPPSDKNRTPADYGEIARKMGMDQKCIQEAKNVAINSQSSTNVVLVTPFGGGGGSHNTTDSHLDTGMTSEGCGKMSFTATTMLEEEKTMTCNMNKTLSGQDVKSTASSKLLIELVPPSEETIAGILETIRTMENNISRLQLAAAALPAFPPMPTSGSVDPGVLKILTDLLILRGDNIQRSIDVSVAALKFFIETNPVAANIVDSNVSQKITSNISIKSSQNIDDTTKSTMIDSLKRVATAIALDKVSTHQGVGALPQNVKDAVISEVEKSVLKETKNITETITKNSLSSGVDNTIVARIYGGIKGSNIDQGISSQVSLAVSQTMKKTVEIANTVAAHIISTTESTRIDDSILDGIDKILTANADGQAKMAEQVMSDLADTTNAVGTGLGAAAKGIGDGVGSAAEGIGKGVGSMMSAAMIPLIIVGCLVVGAFFIVPKLMPMIAQGMGISPGMMKFVGYAVIAVIILLIILWVIVPIFKGDGAAEERRRSYKMNGVAPVQRAANNLNVKQSLTPYGRELRYEGDRSARKIPSYLKIDNSNNYRSPTESKHVNKYNMNDDSKDISTVHVPTVHVQNKSVYKQVMYNRG